MKIAITPRFYETKENRFIVVEEKYYPFMKKWGHEINLIPFMGKNISDYLGPNGKRPSITGILASAVRKSSAD